MSELTVTAKGQITLRREVLRHLGVEPGQKVELALLPDHGISLRPVAHGGTWEAFFSVLDGQASRALSLEEIEDAIASGWAGTEE